MITYSNGYKEDAMIVADVLSSLSVYQSPIKVSSKASLISAIKEELSIGNPGFFWYHSGIGHCAENNDGYFSTAIKAGKEYVWRRDWYTMVYDAGLTDMALCIMDVSLCNAPGAKYRETVAKPKQLCRLMYKIPDFGFYEVYAGSDKVPAYPGNFAKAFATVIKTACPIHLLGSRINDLMSNQECVVIRHYDKQWPVNQRYVHRILYTGE